MKKLLVTWQWKLPGSWRIFIRGRIFIKKRFALLLALFFVFPVVADWSVDFSRRTQKMSNKDLRSTAASPDQPKRDNFFNFIFQAGEPIQEIVILNTEHGFVPETIRVRQGLQYKIHVVNVNENEKNVSFILDSFSEHHGTYFGKIKTFRIKPRKEGVYSYQCPETSAQGKLVVYPPTQKAPPLRLPASEE